eukprot:TRINITY_DN10264_c0_g1_i1.p1 TRINITY_DN10264_c0_g1~~TRINITY_DN10264_c0_g1_i1.p1  ORF type:complete len:418 (+),score=81.81 TRINITY_DN10264_c0_g1_i1:39-1292(+)
MNRALLRSSKLLNQIQLRKILNDGCKVKIQPSATFWLNCNHQIRHYSNNKDKSGDKSRAAEPEEEPEFDDPGSTESERSHQLITAKYFRVNEEEQNKKSFEGAIDIFTHKDGRRRGDVEFIYGALKNMEKFGVHKDLQSYKKLMNVFPKGKYVPENRIQADFFHYPNHQDCAIAIMVKMEENKIIPDEEMGDMIINIFGKLSEPFKKYCRCMYWYPKLKNISPWLLPDKLPDDALELALIGIEQITSVDRLTEINVYETKELEQATDKTWIVSGQSPEQMKLLKEVEIGSPIYVEGAFRLWLDDCQVNYFILRGPPKPRHEDAKLEVVDIEEIRMWMDGEKEKHEGRQLNRYPSVHEQEDGVIYAVCATGTSSRESLLSWIRFLEKENPHLSDLAVLFTLQSPLGPVTPVKESTDLH